MLGDKSLYPPNWNSEIVPRILQRAGFKCERCGIPRYSIGTRLDDGTFLLSEVASSYREAKRIAVEFQAVYQIKPTIVRLHVAHIYPEPADVRDENLLALCDYEHLIFDGPLHARNAKRTRARKKQERLWDDKNCVV